MPSAPINYNYDMAENHCEKHFNFKGQCCPVCLLKAKEAAEAALKEALEELAKAQQQNAHHRTLTLMP